MWIKRSSGKVQFIGSEPSMSSFRRVFSSSVGSKLLIGLTGLALFAYMLAPPRRQSPRFHRAGDVQRVFTSSDLQPSRGAGRDRPAARVPAPRLQDGEDVDRQPVRSTRCVSEEGMGWLHEPEEPVVRHDDLLGPDDLSVRAGAREAVQVRHDVPDRQPGGPGSVSHRGRSLQPAGLGRAVRGVRRDSSPLHLRHGIAERRSVDGRRSSDVYDAGSCSPGRSWQS